MPLATVVADIAPLMEEPSNESFRLDEMLCGMLLQVLDTRVPGWCYVRSEYGIEGYVSGDCLNLNADVAAGWKKYKKQVVLASYIDVLGADYSDAPRIASVPRGGVLVALPKPPGSPWQKVGLPSGQKGFTRPSYLAEAIADWGAVSEEDMRWNLVETALSYNGTAYRVGGRTPLGIDSVGLVYMTYLLNGVLLEQSLSFIPGAALRRIRFDGMKEGDVIYFERTLGIYIGENRFAHATEFPGNEGVVVSSLIKDDADYREDLAEGIVCVASLY